MADKEKRSEKHQEARDSLSEELKPIFDEFVDDYKYAGLMKYGSPFVSYAILAEMVRVGWRRSAEAVPEDGRLNQQ